MGDHPRLRYRLSPPVAEMRLRMREIGEREVASRWRWLFWETLIIVVGVLIAFGVNDYWTGRQDRALELHYVKRILAEVEYDIEWVGGFWNDYVAGKYRALDAIAPVVRGKEPVPQDLETFFDNVGQGGRAGLSPPYWVTTTTFDDLKATGNLRLIRNADFRSKINKYYRDYEDDYRRLRARTTGYSMFVHSIYPSELRGDKNMKAIEAFGVERALERIQSEEFQNLLNQEFNFAYFLRNRQTRFLAAAEALSRELEAHIRQLED